MKIAIFDVSNGSCALAVCSNGNSLMIDCGSHAEKDCPVEKINALRITGGWLSHMKNFYGFPLTKLVISHPDIDHLKNIEKVHIKFTPYLLHRRYIEEFPVAVVDQDDANYKYYKDRVDVAYRAKQEYFPTWGFSEKSYAIPMNILKENPMFGESKVKNNSSLVYLLQYGNFRILFGGDMEEAGWDWLIANNWNGFKDDISKGINVIIASHHGHTSGYSQNLMNLMGKPQLSILSKGMEEEGETDVDSRYSANSSSVVVNGLALSNKATKKTLTTRSNGNIYLQVEQNNTMTIWADTIS